MIRFTSTQLRPLLSQQGGMQRPLVLEKNLGIYLRVPDDSNPGEWLKAWAEGCNPSVDKDWSDKVDVFIPEKEFSFETFMAHSIYDAVLNENHDLIMTPLNTWNPASITIRSETHPPEKVFVPVGEYRDSIQWLFSQSGRHFHACVGNQERLNWRAQALYVLDQVIRLDSRRAKPEDRDMFYRAVKSVRSRVREVMSDGSVRHF